MRSFSILLPITFALIAVGCNSVTSYRSAKFADEREAYVQQIGNAMDLGLPIDIIKEGNYLFVLAYTPEYWLHVFDKKTGEKITDAIRVGRGPGECVSLSSMDYFVKDKNIYVYDMTLLKTLVYHIDGESFQISFVREIQHPLNSVIRKCHHLGDGYFIYEGYLPGGNNHTRFTLSDGEEALDTYSVYPELSKEYDRYAFISAVTKGYPEMNMVVSATMFGAVLECLHDSGGQLECTAIRLIDKPEMDPSSSIVDIKPGGKYGFLALCPTKDLIYAVYINSTVPGDFKSIVSFDWNGTEKTRYTADRNILRICSGDTPNELYGISSSSEMEFALVRIMLI